MKKLTLLAVVFFAFAFNAFAQDGSSPGYFDSRGNWHEDPIWNQRQEQQTQNMLNTFQDSWNQAQQHQRELQRIEAEQAVERQRAQAEQAARQEELRIQREQAEQAAMRNWRVTVYGTTLWKDGEPSGLKERQETFTITESSAEKAEAKGEALFRSKWKPYLVDAPNIWANAVLQ